MNCWYNRAGVYRQHSVTIKIQHELGFLLKIVLCVNVFYISRYLQLNFISSRKLNKMVLRVAFQDRLFIPFNHFMPCGRKFLIKGTERETRIRVAFYTLVFVKLKSTV